MKKELTQEQLAKRQAKEQAKAEKIAVQEANEIVLRKKQSARKVGKFYLLILMIVMTLAYLVDETSTNITYALQSNIIIDLFHAPLNPDGTVIPTSPEWIQGTQSFSTLTIVFALFAFAMPFYKSLADKYGRKFLLVINTMAMAICMLIVMVAPNWTVFSVAYIALNFVVPTDVHSLYFMESAPAKHRVKISLGAKAIAILGISSIGLLRLWFLDSSNVGSWRTVYLIPTILACGVALVVLCFIKETPQFVKDRLETLQKTPEQRKAEAEADKENQKKVGVLSAAKFVFKHRQLRWISICVAIFSFASIMTTYYSMILAGNGMGDQQISYMVIAYPFIYSLMTFLGGVISDKWGRKAMVLSYGTMAMVAMILFCLLSGPNNGVFSGLIYGVYVAGLWGTLDSLGYVMSQESSPTYLRASCMGIVVLCALPSSLVAMVLVLVLVEFLPLATIAIGLTILGLLPCMLLVLTKVNETYKVDLETVSGDEWDIKKA